MFGSGIFFLGNFDFRIVQNEARIAVQLLLTAVCLLTNRFGAAQEIKFEFCTGAYALCAASICRPTGKTIQVNGSQHLFR